MTRIEDCKMSVEILVSICYITYNHEKYIRDALEGFISQNVNFKYEVCNS